jgi:hypothetical protein
MLAKPPGGGLVDYSLYAGLRHKLGTVGPHLGYRKSHTTGNIGLPGDLPGPFKENVKIFSGKTRRFQQNAIRGA